MAKTLSTMIPLGSPAPEFHLRDAVSNQMYKFSNTAKAFQGTLIMFICNHCPYVKHLMDGITKLTLDYAKQPICFLAINSNNHPDYPDDSFEKMQILAKEHHLNFPYLFDETQEVAKSYQAACTPDFFLYDHNNQLVYRGQFDDSRPGNTIPVTGEDIRNAIDCLLKNQANQKEQKPSIGCNIKWNDTY